ncbi:MAG: hypothetical protein DMD91_04575 [Candidatus Rokuibacteriota bacterium]|nr:MAG: hypothetical protein DMD91_04575 [Candidatus Rokubacteria bacterium]
MPTSRQPKRRSGSGVLAIDTAPAMPRIVALGGGTGLPVLLSGLKEALFPRERVTWARRDRLTAVVTVADDGGSSGRLRQTYGMLPPGDIRNCLLALSSGQSMLAPLFNFRFGGTQDVGGHSLGNLILSALTQLENDFCAAVEHAGRMLGICGRILPATLAEVTVTAQFDDGTSIAGESRIASRRQQIRRVRLEPAGARVLPDAVAAIEAADVIAIGPGSLYTSLIPILLVEGVVEALNRARGRVLLVMNLMTEPGETEAFTAVDHLLAIRRHAPKIRIDDVLLNTTPIAPALLARYSAAGAVPVTIDREILRALGYRPLERDLLRADLKIRHDPGKLAHAVIDSVVNRETK